MRMKSLAPVLVCLISIRVSALCPRDNPTPVVHVVFEECGVLKPRMKIKIDGATRDAAQKDDHYEADYTGHPVDATMEIVVPGFDGVRKCCYSAKESPLGRNDCYVEFTVTCDKPGWKLSIDSAAPVKFERAHRNDLGDPECRAGGADPVHELSARDDAILTVPRSFTDFQMTLSEITPRPQLDLKITLTALLQQAGKPFDREHLGQLLKQELGRQTKAQNISAAAEPLVDLIKLTLPNSVTVNKQ